MKKALRSFLSLTMALLMLSSGIIPAFASTPSIDLALEEQTNGYFSGVAYTVTATVSTLTAEPDDSALITWTLTGNDTQTDYSTNISCKNPVTSQLSSGGYSYTQEVSVTMPIDSDGYKIEESVTISAQYVDSTNSVDTSTSITVDLKQPITSFDITESDTNDTSYYNPETSTLYIDYYYSSTYPVSTHYASFDITTYPSSNDDTYSFIASDIQSGTTVHVTTNSDSVDAENSIIVSKDADSTSYVTISPSSGYSGQKRIDIVKCIPMIQFYIGDGSNTYLIVSSSSSSSNTMKAYTNDTVTLSASSVKANNGTTNDKLIYEIYNTAGDLVGYSGESNPQTCIVTLDDSNGCGIEFLKTGSYTVKVFTRSKDSGTSPTDESILARSLEGSFPVEVTQTNAITSLSFDSDTPDYIYTDNTLDLASYLTINPDNYTQNDYVTYSVDSTKIATIDSSTGVLTGKSSGTVTVTATSRISGITATCQVSVKAAASSITLSAELTELPQGHSEQVVATITPTTAEETLTWTSSNTAALTVDENGYITAVEDYVLADENGESVSITCTAASGVKIEPLVITVIPSVNADEINISVAAGTSSKVNSKVAGLQQVSDDTYSVYQNDEITATADVGDSTDEIIWRVSVGSYTDAELSEASSYFASYSVDGNSVTIKGSSSTLYDTTLTAYAVSSQSADISTATASKSINITYRVPASSTSVSDSKKTLGVGDSFEVTATLKPTNTSDSFYYTIDSGSEFISVTQNNNVLYITADSIGVSTISWYTSYDSNNYQTEYTKKGTITVTVLNNINDAVVSGLTSVIYNGSAYKVDSFEDFAVTYDGTLLASGSSNDYTISYSDNTNAGTASIILTGTNKENGYSSTKTVNFTIEPKNINTATVSDISDVTYTGSALEPKVTVKDTDRNKTLTKDTDYTVTYSNNTNVGIATVKITGIGNYTGTYTTTFNITAYNISKCKAAAIASYAYTGSPIKPTPTLTYGSITLTKNDYSLIYENNTNTGTATIYINGQGNYTGQKKVTFKITKLSAENFSISSISNQTYTGLAITPSVVVKYSSKTLTKDTDYTVSYSSNKNTGIATVKITGKGNYSGSKSVTFVIVPKKPTGLKASSRTTSSVKLKWNEQSEASGYIVYKYNSSKKKYVKVKTITSKSTVSCKVSKLSAGTTYKFKVVAYVTGSDGNKYKSSGKTYSTVTKPSKVKIKSVKASKKAFTVKWKKVSKCTGYQIRYAKDKKFKKSVKTVTVSKKSTVSKKISKLSSKKTYYVKVRSYVKYDGKKYYSSWSTVKSVKTK